jgi:hypothetical protein
MSNYNSNKPTPKPLPTDEQLARNISALNRTFREAADEFKQRGGGNSNVRGTTLHRYQVDFAYLIDEIQRGPRFFAVQNIVAVNDLIARLRETNKS